MKPRLLCGILALLLAAPLLAAPPAPTPHPTDNERIREVVGVGVPR
jgi:hypothetical protein